MAAPHALRPPRAAPAPTPAATSGPRTYPRRPRRLPGSRFSDRQSPPTAPPTRGTDPISDTPLIGLFSVRAATDGPRVMPENPCISLSCEWWPGAESNHRHADFQDDGGPASARVSSRRTRRGPPRRPTEPPRPTEPIPNRSPETLTEDPTGPSWFNGLRPCQPNSFRTSRRTEPAGPGCPRTTDVTSRV